MNKIKSTKRALIMSAAAVLMSISMLIGTTYAWFTDTASTGVNKIVSGSLKVDIIGEDSDTHIDTLNFKNAAGAEGEALLWEPGCRYLTEGFRIANKGNLALKWKAQVNKGTTAANEGNFDLLDVIDFYLVTKAADGTKTETALDEFTGNLKKTETSEVYYIKGVMKTTAGNDYQGLTLDGITITVIATQDTVEYDSFDNTYDEGATYPVRVDGIVKVNEDTILKDKPEDYFVQVTIPAGSVENAEKVSLVVVEGSTTPSSITVETGTQALTAEVKLIDQDGNKVNAASGKFFTVSMNIGKNLNVVDFYHNEMALTKVADVNSLTANDQYCYDGTTGYVTFTTDDFSPFTSIVSDSAFNGGDGTEAHPYLIATGEQAMQIEKLKKGAHLKLVKDITVPDEIYMSGKKFFFDLNGHTVKLEYAEGVKPNNGSVLYIGGKSGNLTINDSSAAQTGAVIGSDKSYPNKVTSAVRAGNYGKLTINGGHFYGTSEGTSCIFVYTSMSSGSKATVTINGGKFETATPSNGTYFVLNHQDNASAGCMITVNGGSFRNYNPGVTTVDPVNAKTGKIVLGEGCTTTQDGEWYVVSN